MIRGISIRNLNQGLHTALNNIVRHGVQIGVTLLLISSFSARAQMISDDFTKGMDDDLSIGGDIFSDFDEDLEAAQIVEDERFYRYGRFYSLNVGLGITTFTGNRGKAYDDDLPTYGLSVVYFFNFDTALTMGFELSRHHMILDTETLGYKGTNVGLININMLRPFWGLKYYVDTTDLGTAVTYSNPYFVGRIEYWYQTVKFIDSEEFGTESKGAIGASLGVGLEFPVELKVSYIGLEFLWHTVNFYDKWTQNYRQDPSNKKSTYGYDDLSGDALSAMVTYNLSW